MMKALAFQRHFLDSRVEKQVKTDTLIEHAEHVLNNKTFGFSDRTYKQICKTAIGTKACSIF